MGKTLGNSINTDSDGTASKTNFIATQGVNNVLLTGATGVLGTHMLKGLLLDYSVKVYCLVRAESTEQGLQRLRSLLTAYDPENRCAEAFAERVVPVLGDVSREHLGLELNAYEELADLIDLTIHAAADTNLFSNFRRLEGVNVGGARNMVAFALKTESRDLCYVSTYTVMGDKTFDRTLVFKESDLDVGQGFEHMSYQKSKFIAENIVRDAGRDHGLQWNIVRPGQIYGESETGFYPQGLTNVSGLFYDIFKTVVETGVALRSNTYFDVTPVDYVSRGALHVSLDRGERQQTYHLTNPDKKTYTGIIETLASLGYDITFVSQDEYKRMLHGSELKMDGVDYQSITTKAFKWWFKREQFDFENSCITDCQFTASILARAGIYCPKIDQKLLGTYVAAAVRLGYMPAPNQARVEKPAEYASQVGGVAL